MSEFLAQIWGIDALYIDQGFTRAVDGESAAIILAACPQNYDRFARLETFASIFSNLNLELNPYSVQLMQIGILNAMTGLSVSRPAVLAALETLQKESVISFSHFERLRAFISNLKIDESKAEATSGLTFQGGLSNLNAICDELASFDFADLAPRLNSARETANEAKFTIAVTGVINAGKSSTLNALMGKKILGVSNIPETANLSVIGYGQKDEAIVEFWDAQTLAKMGLESENLAPVAVPLDRLGEFTGAGSQISQKVKLVRLSAPLEILRDNIEIVDTPGLDDAVVFREELTRRFVVGSDFIMHLMNACQSATKKDMKFITEALASGKSGSIAIVLTHADLVSRDGLAEVMDYTRRAVASELKDAGFDDTLANEARFFAICAPTGMGMSELKNYLYETLFGANSKKAAMILGGYKKELALVAKLAQERVESVIKAFSLDASQAREKVRESEREISNLNEKAENATAELNAGLERLKYDSSELGALKNIVSALKSRVISDARYAATKGQKMDLDAVFAFCEGRFRDLFIDLFRDFKTQINAQMTDLKERFTLALGVNDFKFETPDIKAYFDEKFSQTDYAPLKFELASALKQKDLNALEKRLVEVFEGFLAGLNLKAALGELSGLCVADFVEQAKNEIEALKSNLKERQNALTTLVAAQNQKSDDLAKMRAKAEEKLAKIKSIRARLA